MDIEELIFAIQKRPLMFMEVVRVDYIFYIVKGYLCGTLRNENAKNIKFHSEFYRWILKRANENTEYTFEVQDGFYWCNILTRITSSTSVS